MSAHTKYHILNTGFTLIELLVVISIIGILIGLSVFGLQGSRKASRDAVRKADLEQIRSGLGFYKTDCDTYPSTTDFLLPGAANLHGSGVGSCLDTNKYISNVPADPLPTSNYSYVSSDGISYYLCALLEQPPVPLMDPTLLHNCGNCTETGVLCNYVTTNP